MAGYDVAVTSGRGLAAFLCLLAACCLALGVPLLVAMLQLRDLHIRYDDAGPIMSSLNSSQDREAALWRAAAASPPAAQLSLPQLDSAAAQFGITQQTNRSSNSSHAAGGLTAPAQPQVTPGAATAEALLQTVEVEVPHDMVPPVYLYYQLPWFYQNHKRYVRSISWSQMAGAAGPLEALPSCEPLRYLGGRRDTSLPDQGAIHPCGLIPSSLFNDSFSLHQTCDDAALSGHIPLHLDVAFRSELATALFSNPRNATNLNTVASLRGGGTLEGPVGQAPQLWVWSRVAAQPGLTKPFAVINTRLAKGCRLRLEVANRYNSYAWGGQKAVLLSTASWAASTRNLFLPVLYLVMAGGCGVSALGLVALGVVTRRRDKAI